DGPINCANTRSRSLAESPPGCSNCRSARASRVMRKPCFSAECRRDEAAMLGYKPDPVQGALSLVFPGARRLHGFLRQLRDDRLVPAAGDAVADTCCLVDLVAENALQERARGRAHRTADQRTADRQRTADMRRDIHGLIVVLALEPGAAADANVGGRAFYFEVRGARVAGLQREPTVDRIEAE